jgi:hypothetical protein
MKKVSFLVTITAIVIAASCNNQPADTNKANGKQHDEMQNMKMDSMNMENMDSTMHNTHQMKDSMDKK